MALLTSVLFIIGVIISLSIVGRFVFGPDSTIVKYTIIGIAFLMGSVVNIAIMDVACQQNIHFQKIGMGSLTEVFKDRYYLIRSSVLGVIVTIAYNLLDVGIRHMSTSIMNSMCSGSIIWLAVLLITCLFISVIIINGLTFSSYFIGPCGGNTSLISSLGKGMLVSFRNLSASVVVMISAIIFFFAVIGFLSAPLLLKVSSGDVSFKMFAIYAVILLVAYLISFYAYVCFICKIGNYVTSDESPVVTFDDNDSPYNTYGNQY